MTSAVGESQGVMQVCRSLSVMYDVCRKQQASKPAGGSSVALIE